MIYRSINLHLTCIRNGSGGVLFQKEIDFRTDKENADTDIQPQHQYHNGGQASVHIRIIAEIVKIDRKQGGEDNPPGRTEQGPRQLAAHGMLSHRNQSIETGENKNQQP